MLDSLGKRSRKAAHVLALFTALSVSACSSENTNTEPSAADQSRIEQIKARAQDRLEQAKASVSEMKKDVARASELAEKMGVPFDSQSYKISQDSLGNITEINGQKVSPDLYTETQRESIENRDNYSKLMGDEAEKQPKEHPKDTVTGTQDIESAPIDTSVY